jgi:hypothetical protein
MIQHRPISLRVKTLHYSKILTFRCWSKRTLSFARHSIDLALQCSELSSRHHVRNLCKAADGTSSAQHRIIEHFSYSAFSTSWTHNTVPSAFKYSPHQLIRGALGMTVFE